MGAKPLGGPKGRLDKPVELPDALLAKWKSEGRLSTELDELQTFFQRTGYPRAPRFYIIKWLTDYVNDLGIDGFRVDAVPYLIEREGTSCENLPEAHMLIRAYNALARMAAPVRVYLTKYKSTAPIRISIAK